MLKNSKSRLRDLLPKGLQVPAKYWYRRMRGELEEEMELLGLIVRKHELVIDVGANRGVYAYRLWRLGAEVEVFEPNPDCFGVLSAWAVGKSRVNLHSVALSNCEGSANLHIPIDEAGVEHDASASIEQTSFEHARNQLVSLRTLDSYGFEGVSLIKIDVEGHECGVVEGARETLVTSKPVLLIEIEERHSGTPIKEVFDKILALGYRGFFLEQSRLTSLEKFEVAHHQPIGNFVESKGHYINNFLFFHRDRLASGEYNNLVKGTLRV